MSYGPRFRCIVARSLGPTQLDPSSQLPPRRCGGGSIFFTHILSSAKLPSLHALTNDLVKDSFLHAT